MRSALAIAALVLSISSAQAIAPVAPMPQTQSVPTGAATKAGPCRDAQGKFVKCAIPVGATAKCKDGSFSMQKTRAGACSRHGGVDTWLSS